MVQIKLLKFQQHEKKTCFNLLQKNFLVNILIVKDKNPSLGCLTKQLKTSPIIWSGGDMTCYILLTIPDKDCFHSALGVGLVHKLVVGPIPGAVPTGPVPGIAPGLVTAKIIINIILGRDLKVCLSQTKNSLSLKCVC